MMDFERAKRMVLERASAASFQNNACVELLDLLRRIEAVAGYRWRNPAHSGWDKAGLAANVAMVAQSSIGVEIHHKFEKRLGAILTKRLPGLMPFLVQEMIRDLARDAGMTDREADDLIDVISHNEALLKEGE